MKQLRRGAIGLGISIALFAGSAQADPINFGFQLSFSAGSLAGQTALGSISLSSFDCPGLICSGTFTSAGPTGGATGSLLDFRVSVNGTTFIAASDSGYPDFPSVTFSSNRLTGIDFLADRGGPSLSLSFASTTAGGPLIGTGSYVSALGATSIIGSVTPVPEPSTALMLICALTAGAGFMATRPKENA